MLVIDPERQRPAANGVLSSMYGLTNRDTDVAAALSTGETLERTAAALGMSCETARSHLRRIFDKTGTSRQNELMLMLARLPKDPAPA